MLTGGGGGPFPAIPGDPAGIRSAAQQIGRLAGEIGDQGGALVGTATSVVGTSWSGMAADRFGSVVSRLGQAHRDVGAGLVPVAGALDAYAAALEDCQNQLAHAGSVYAEAEQQAQSDTAQLDTAIPASRATTDPQLARYRADQLTCISENYAAATAAATNLANDALDRHQAAVATLRSHLLRAADDGHASTSLLDGIATGLGVPNTALGALATVALARSGGRLATLGAAFDRALGQEFGSAVGALGLRYDRGELTYAELEDRAGTFLESSRLARNAFRSDGLFDLAGGGVRSVLGTSRLATNAVRVVGGLAIAGDVLTFVHPDEGGAWGRAEQGMAAANAVGTAGSMGADLLGLTNAGALLAADGTLGWVPVAGQVLIVGTGLFLAGDFLYTHTTWFHDGIDDAGHFVARSADEVGHALGDAASSVAHFFGL